MTVRLLIKRFLMFGYGRGWIGVAVVADLFRLFILGGA